MLRKPSARNAAASPFSFTLTGRYSDWIVATGERAAVIAVSY